MLKNMCLAPRESGGMSSLPNHPLLLSPNPILKSGTVPVNLSYL